MTDIETTSNINTYPKIFVGNVPYNCTLAEFVACFDQHTGYRECDVIKKVDSDKTRGFGFVIVETIDDMTNLLNQHIILQNRKLRLDRYTQQNDNDVLKGFVRNIPYDTTPDELKKCFRVFGPIINCTVSQNMDISNKITTGIIEFEKKQSLSDVLDAKKIILNKNNKKTTLQIYPFRRKNKKIKSLIPKNDPKNIYRSGFEAGKLIGFEEGYRAANM
jgi:RNA recognition motif-containing protein